MHGGLCTFLFLNWISGFQTGGLDYDVKNVKWKLISIHVILFFSFLRKNSNVQVFSCWEAVDDFLQLMRWSLPFWEPLNYILNLTFCLASQFCFYRVYIFAYASFCLSDNEGHSSVHQKERVLNVHLYMHFE